MVDRSRHLRVPSEGCDTRRKRADPVGEPMSVSARGQRHLAAGCGSSEAIRSGAARTVVAHMLPSNPAALNIRTREQARASGRRPEAPAPGRGPICYRTDPRRPGPSILNGPNAAASAPRPGALDRRGQGAVDRGDAETARRRDPHAPVRAAMPLRATLIAFDDQDFVRALEPERRGQSPCWPPPTPHPALFQAIGNRDRAGTPILRDRRYPATWSVAELCPRRGAGRGGIRSGFEDLGGRMPGRHGGPDRPGGCTRGLALVEEHASRGGAPDRSARGAPPRWAMANRVEARNRRRAAEAALIAPQCALFRHEGGWVVAARADAPPA